MDSDSFVADPERAVVVHILHYGRALCPHMLALPRDWPIGHLWTVLARHEDATCHACVQAAIRLMEVKDG